MLLMRGRRYASKSDEERQRAKATPDPGGWTSDIITPPVICVCDDVDFYVRASHSISQILHAHVCTAPPSGGPSAHKGDAMRVPPPTN